VLVLTIEKLRDGAVRDLDMIGSFILGASRMLAVNLKRRDRRREALASHSDRDRRTGERAEDWRVRAGSHCALISQDASSDEP
jgi:hypothetical protein